MWKQIFEMGLFVTLALSGGFAQQLSTTSFDTFMVVPVTSTAVSSSGSILLADAASNNVKEIQNGKTVRDYSHPPYSRLAFAAFGPADERYLLFHGPMGLRIQVYAADGQKNGDVSSIRIDFHPVGFQVDSQSQILLLRDQNETPAGGNLIYKFNPAGNLVTSFFPNPGQGGARRQEPRIVVGANDELAVLIPERETIYWFDRNGNLIRRASLSSRATAIGLVDGELWVAGADETPIPSSRPGVHSVRLSSPVLHRLSRSGADLQSALPRELAGTNHIDRRGNLIRVTNQGVTILRR